MKTFFLMLSPRERLLAGLVAIALVGAFLSMVLSPQVRELKRLLHERTVLQKIIQNSDGPKTGAGGAVSGPSFSEAGGSAPLSTIVFDLARLVESHQLVLSSVKPASPEDRGDYREYKVAIDLSGRYRNVVEFLEGMEQLPRWIIVSDVRVEENAEKIPGVLAHLSAVVFEEKEGS